MAEINVVHVSLLIGGIIVAAAGSSAIDLFMQLDAEREQRLAAIWINPDGGMSRGDQYGSQSDNDVDNIPDNQ